MISIAWISSDNYYDFSVNIKGSSQEFSFKLKDKDNDLELAF